MSLSAWCVKSEKCCKGGSDHVLRPGSISGAGMLSSVECLFLPAGPGSFSPKNENCLARADWRDVFLCAQNISSMRLGVLHLVSCNPLVSYPGARRYKRACQLGAALAGGAFSIVVCLRSAAGHGLLASKQSYIA